MKQKLAAGLAFLLSSLPVTQTATAQQATLPDVPALESQVAHSYNDFLTSPPVSVDEEETIGTRLQSEISGDRLCLQYAGDLDSGLFFQPQTLDCIFANLDSAIEVITAPIPDTNVGWRLLDLSASTYLGLLGLGIHHEAGHYGESTANGVHSRLNLRNAFALQMQVEHPGELGGYFDNPDLSPQRQMASSGRGMGESTHLSRAFLQEWQEEEQADRMSTLLYLLAHSDPVRYAVSSSFGGSSQDNDVEIYEEALHADRFLLNNPELYNATREHTENDFVTAALWWNVLDPHAIWAAVQVGEYVATGDSEIEPLPASVPQVNGLLTAYGPMHQLAWVIPLENGTLTADAALGFSPTLSGAFGAALDQYQIGHGFDVSLGGSFNPHETEDRFYWSAHGEAEIGWSNEALRLSAGVIAKTGGWTEAMFGARSGISGTLGIEYRP